MFAASPLYQIFSDHETVFPRAAFLERQERAMRAMRAALDEQTDLPDEAAPAAEAIGEGAVDGEPGADEPMPETVEELQEALRQARAEARKWRTAYDQYTRITHAGG